jgi:pimeloyl-ACP methyl ester carboxylesterase
MARETLVLADNRQITTRWWPGHGRPLVMLHGLLDSSAGWKAVAASTHRPCLAIDLPGFGGSDPPAAATMAALADDVVEVIDQHGLDELTLVGHSLGGGVAALAAERRVSRVNSLVLMAPVGFGRLPLAEWAAQPAVSNSLRLLLPLALANPFAVTAAYSTMVSRYRLPSLDLLARLNRHCLDNVDGTIAALEAIAVAGRDLPTHRSRYHGAVSVLWGTHDAIVPRSHLDGIRIRFPQLRSELWDGIGHHPQREAPARLLRYLERACARGRQIRLRRAGAQVIRRELAPTGSPIPLPGIRVAG